MSPLPGTLSLIDLSLDVGHDGGSSLYQRWSPEGLMAEGTPSTFTPEAGTWGAPHTTHHFYLHSAQLLECLQQYVSGKKPSMGF